MQKKLLIISLNKLPVEFWYQHLCADDFVIEKRSILHIAEEIPTPDDHDAIIIDDYFMREQGIQWMQETTESVLASEITQNIFCVSPTFLNGTNTIGPRVSQATCLFFGTELFQSIYATLFGETDTRIA